MSRAKTVVDDFDVFDEDEFDRTADWDALSSKASPVKLTKKPVSADLDAADLFGGVDSVVESILTDENKLAAESAWQEVSDSGAVQAQQSADKTLAEWIEHFDREHFVCFHGANFNVFRETFIDGRGTLQRMTDIAFKKYHINKYIHVKKSDGNFKPEPVSKLWLETTQRRYQQMVFDPSGKHSPENYNLWRGFGLEPKEYDEEKIKLITEEFIFKVLCDEDRDAAEYVLNWLAHGVQNPAIKPGVAIVLRGAQGTGKSTLGRLMSEIWGGHGITVSHSKHLTGSFNDHLRTAVFVHSEEAQFVGDQQGHQVLKALITEAYGIFESKGVDADLRKNFIRVLITTNHDWVVNVSSDARRYFVLDVSDRRRVDQTNPRKNRDFWEKLNAYIDDTGAAEFLDYLLKRDITGFVPAVFPQNQALARQRALSLGPTHEYLVHLVSEGFLIHKEWADEEVSISTSQLYDSLLEHGKKRGLPTRYLSPQIFGSDLAKLGVRKVREPRGRALGKRGYEYVFPPRAVFAATLSNTLGLPRDMLFIEDDLDSSSVQEGS